MLHDLLDDPVGTIGELPPRESQNQPAGTDQRILTLSVVLEAIRQDVVSEPAVDLDRELRVWKCHIDVASAAPKSNRVLRDPACETSLSQQSMEPPLGFGIRTWLESGQQLAKLDVARSTKAGGDTSLDVGNLNPMQLNSSIQEIARDPEPLGPQKIDHGADAIGDEQATEVGVVAARQWYPV
jgi:hypothetical protein